MLCTLFYVRLAAHVSTGATLLHRMKEKEAGHPFYADSQVTAKGEEYRHQDNDSSKRFCCTFEGPGSLQSSV